MAMSSLNMSNAGHPEPQMEPPESPEADLDASVPFLWWFVLAGIGVFIAGGLAIALQVVPVLFAVAFPPLPPLPDGINERAYENISYGVDRWDYASDRNACAIIADFEAFGGACPALGTTCFGVQPGDDLEWFGRRITCGGETPFAGFLMQWRATITTAPDDESAETTFSLRREIFWGGQVPPDMDRILSEETGANP